MENHWVRFWQENAGLLWHQNEEEGTILPEHMDLMLTEFSVMADGEKCKNLV